MMLIPSFTRLGSQSPFFQQTAGRMAEWRPVQECCCYCLTTVADRHEELPAASNALKVMVLVPKVSGMLVAIQVRVPLAKPDAPVEFVHVTWVTPTLSVAVPRKLMVVALVERTLAAG